MSCITKLQWNEAYVEEKKKLLKLEKAGQDIDEAMAELEELNQSWLAQDEKRAAKAVMNAALRYDNISQDTIGRMNSESPKDYRGSPIRLVRGRVDNNGAVQYDVLYKDEKQEYTLNGAMVRLDGMDAVQDARFGSDAKPFNHSGFVEVDKEIWNNPKEAMKLVDEIIELEGDVSSSISKEHTEYLRKLIEDVVDPISNVVGKFKVLTKSGTRSKGEATVVGNRKIELEYNVNPVLASNEMTGVETFAHELEHMAVETARALDKIKTGKLDAEMQDLYEMVLPELDYTDFMRKNVINKELEEKIAKERYAYITRGKASDISEFIAFGRTNEALKSKLEKIQITPKVRDKYHIKGSAWSWLANIMIRAYDMIVERFVKQKDVTAMDAMNRLVARYYEINGQVVNKNIQTKSMLDWVMDKQRQGFEIANAKLIKGIQTGAWIAAKGIESVFGEAGKKTTNAIKYTISPWLTTEERIGKQQALMAYNDWFEETWLGGIFAPEGFIGGLVNAVGKDDKLTTLVEKLGLMTTKLDVQRNHTINAVGKSILGELPKGISESKQRILTNVLVDNDLQSLLGDTDGLKKIQKALQSPAELEKMIVEERAKLYELIGGDKNKKQYNYYTSQAKGLGKYLATHVGGSSVQRSADAIYRMLGIAADRVGLYPIQLDEISRSQAITIIDRLASLEALGYTSLEERQYVGNEISLSGLSAVLLHHHKFVIDSAKDRLLKNDTSGMVKGATKDTSHDWVTHRVDSTNEATQKALKKKGYKLVKADIGHDMGYGLYVSKTDSLGKFEKQAAVKINSQKKITDIVDVVLHEGDKATNVKRQSMEIAKINRAVELEIKRQMSGLVEPKMDGYVPISNAEGAYNYGISIEKNVYNKATGQDKRAPLLLGRMAAEIQEKKLADDANGKLLKLMLADQENYRAHRHEKGFYYEYIEVGPDAKNEGRGSATKEYATELFRDMPANMKAEIMKRSGGNKKLAIRRDLATMYLGRRAPSILEAKVPFTGRKTLRTVLEKMKYGNAVVNMVRAGGDIWEEIIRMQKIDVVLRMPDVLFKNILSNFNYSAALGQNPLEVARGQAAAFKATHVYMKDKRALEELTARVESGMTKKTEDLREMKRLKQKLANNMIHPLVESGLFSTVIEDLSNADLNTKTRVDTDYGDYIEKVPKLIRDIVGQVYVSQDTSIFKAMMMATQYSDFVARVNRYHYLIGEGVSNDAAMKMITDEFVNYTKLAPGSAMRWLEAMGPVMFSKYVIGANKNIFQKVTERPIQMIALAGIPNLESPLGASVFLKDFSYTTQTPLESLEKAVDLFVPDMWREASKLLR